MTLMRFMSVSNVKFAGHAMIPFIVADHRLFVAIQTKFLAEDTDKANSHSVILGKVDVFVKCEVSTSSHKTRID